MHYYIIMTFKKIFNAQLEGLLLELKQGILSLFRIVFCPKGTHTDEALFNKHLYKIYMLEDIKCFIS